MTVLDLPGGHVGCVAHPAEFARELMNGLSRPRLPVQGSHALDR